MINKSPYEILVRPIITEKALHGSELDNPQFTFQVALTANKREIKWAVEAAYGVKVQDVQTVRTKGKRKIARSRAGVREGKRPDVKKAIVTLAEGQQIQLM